MRYFIKILCLLVITNGCNQFRASEQIGALTVVHLSGTPYERGFVHGQLLKTEIKIIVERWIAELELNAGDFSQVYLKLLDSTQLIQSIKYYCPELLEEIRGISEGAGMDYQKILAFQMSEELDMLFSDKSQHCTSISIDKTDATPTILAQNMDPPLFLHGFPTLLHISDRKSGLEQFVYTVPGFIGLNGINSKGIGITCNGMAMLNGSKNGLPVSFIVRLILNQENEHKAHRIIREIPIATPQCYTIGGVSGAVCYETSANEVKRYNPFENKAISLHTNFSISNRDFNQKFINLLKQYGKTTNDPYFCPRYFLAYDKIEAYNYILDTERIKTILSSTEPKMEPISNENTYGCLIMELTDNPFLMIAPGKPDKAEFIQLRFNQFRN